MIDGVILWSLRNRAMVIVLAAGLCAFGGWRSMNTPVDVFPDLTAPTVVVVAEAHGMAPAEVEALLTFPLETALNGAANVRRVRSKTSVGLAVVSIDFAWGTNIHIARQVVVERLQLLAGKLPAGIEPPVMGPITSIMGDILFVGMTSTKHDPMALRTAADWTVARRLLAVPGVAQVITIGGDVRQFQVQLDPRRLDAYALTADDVAHALEAANENTSAGFLVHGGQEHLIHGIGRVGNSADIGATLVTQRGDLPILVSDVAKVRVGPALKRGEGGVNGKRGVVVAIRKQPRANTLRLTRRIEEELKSLQTALPTGMKIHPGLFRQASFIEVAVRNVGIALRDGAILVVLIVLVFVSSIRATIITALAIPLSLLTALIALSAYGAEINTMTLGGMAIAVGALVDDAIIDMENVVRRLRLRALQPEQSRAPVLRTVFEASREIRASIVFATFIILLVFVPLFFLSGVEGRLLRPLGAAYMLALTASLGVALTVTPVLCSWLLPTAGAVRKHKEPAIVKWLKAAYRPVLATGMRYWDALLVVAAVAFVVAAIALFGAGRSFLPQFNEGSLTLNLVALPGTSLTKSDALGQRVESILLSHAEVISTARLTGRAAGDEHAQDVHASEVEVRLRPTKRDREAFLAALRNDLAAVAGLAVTIGQPIEHRIDHMLSGTRANIAIKIFGPDRHVLRRLGQRVESAVEPIAGVVDLQQQTQADVPFVQLRFKRRAIARHGLTVRFVSREIETAFAGRAVTRLLDGAAVFDVVVRYAGATERALEDVRQTRIGTPSGARLPLHVLADVQRASGPNRIVRENVQRLLVVSCNVADRDLGSVVNDIRETVAANVPMPAGYRVAYGGQFESAQDALHVLGWVGLAVLLGIFVMLLSAIGSARDALLVMVNLPLALIGGVGGVYLGNGVVSVASVIGFITLFGIATRNGIMLVTHFHHLRDEEGETDPDVIVTRGALERLSPILMTALASGLGLLPLALAAGEPGSEIQAPMALVILCGLATSTALNMLVLPALYRRFGAACAVAIEPPTSPTALQELA